MSRTNREFKPLRVFESLRDHASVTTGDQLRKIIGAQIKTLRKNSGMTQAALAEAVDVDETSLRAIESGRRGPSMDVLAKLAEALAVEPAELLRTAKGPRSAGEEFSALIERLPKQWRDMLLGLAREVSKILRRR